MSPKTINRPAAAVIVGLENEVENKYYELMPDRGTGLLDLDRIIDAVPETLRRDKRIHLTVKG
jgi:hypothetical protein